MVSLNQESPRLQAGECQHYILTFIASQPTPEQISEFRPTPEMQSRLHTLLNRSQSGELTPSEKQELDEYERIEHLILLLKMGNLPQY